MSLHRATPADSRVFTVTDLTRSLRGLLETTFPFVAVCGEISNLRRPSSGHCYFTLKDEGAQLRCVLFKTQQRYLTCRLQDGLAVLCRGRITIYEPRGEYQLVVDTVEPAGAGALQLAFEHLKKRLAAEGLFDPERKRPIPTMPTRIAVISSATGAAIQDFCRTARLRFPLAAITLIPARVQGEEAADDICRAIDLAGRLPGAQVIVLCRGGGSIEDLWPFNEERVARAIAAAPLPVVTGIGHETDFTIADFVADHRAATPTAAAAALTPDGAELRRRIADLGRRLVSAMDDRLHRHRQRLDQYRRLLGTPQRLLDQAFLHLAHRHEALVGAMRHNLARRQQRLDLARQRLVSLSPLATMQHRRLRLDHARQRLIAAISSRLDTLAHNLAGQRALLQAVDPRRVLQRGYALVETQTGELVTDAATVAPGQLLRVTLARGRMQVQRVDSADG